MNSPAPCTRFPVAGRPGPSSPRRAGTAAVIAALGMLGAAAPAVADQPLPLAAAVAAAAKTEVVPVLEREGVKSVGVLKFLAMDGSGPTARPSTRLGAINSDLAAQFQTAILLNVSRRNPITVLRDPSAVAAGIEGATHLSAEGLEKLFAADYPVVVGKPDEKAKPDALLFGIVQLADDLKTATVDVRMVRRGAPEAEKVCAFTAGLGAGDLPAAGQSFVATRGLFTGGQAGDGPAPTPEQVAERPVKLVSLAADVRAGRRPFPLEDASSPVTLSIAYDGAAQKIEFRDGGAFVAEPRQGQKVTITIKKARKDGRRYGVVLKVNGENTAERGVQPDLRGGKWILSDDFMTLPVRGYSLGTDKVQPFTVLSESESAKRAFDYGVDAGTITMTVFAEQTGTPESGSSSPLPQNTIPTPKPPVPPPAPPQIAQGGPGAGAALDQMLLAGGVRVDPKQSFGTLDEAKASLQKSLASASRGLIVPGGDTQAFKKDIVTFSPVPDPVMSVVVRYYVKR